jgi:hypothetical protein
MFYVAFSDREAVALIAGLTLSPLRFRYNLYCLSVGGDEGVV